MAAEPALPDPWQAAADDQDSVVKLIRELVRIPSRGGVDAYEPVLGCMAAWFSERGLAHRVLRDSDGADVALVCEIDGQHAGPRYVLDACLDTAPFGDETAWTYPPTSADIIHGWMHGRGTADSKAGAAIFAHLAARIHAQASRLRGHLVILLDVDEHTGTFGGARAYCEQAAGRQIDGVMIGYPGLDHLVTGGRGIFRARLHVHGVAGHSGGRSTTPSAIAKAAHLVTQLHAAELPSGDGPDFPLPGRLTVSAINGGEGFSTVPDHCVINVDIRLTPAFDADAAQKLLAEATKTVDDAWTGTRETTTEVVAHWPAFALPPGNEMRDALLAAACETGLSVTAKIAGPSNIGNYLAGLGISATAGFGVGYAGLHGTDERIRIDSIPAVQAVYHRALLTLLRMK